MSVTTVSAQGSVPVKGRRKSNSTSTQVTTDESSSGSGTGRKGKSKATKENWDDDFVFHRPPPKAPPRTTRDPSPVPSFADSAIWGDGSDEDDGETDKLSIPHSPPTTSLPTPITPPSETLGLISQEEAEAPADEPARRLVKKHKHTQSPVRLQDDIGSQEALKSRPTSSSTALAAVLRSKDAAFAEEKATLNEAGRSKGVGRMLLGRMSKRFSGTIAPIETSPNSQPLRRLRSSTNVNINKDAEQPFSIRRSSSSILRAIHPSASTSSLVTSLPPVPSYPSPPLTAHPSRGFHLPSPSPNSPYHSSSSLHGSGIISSRSASGSSHRSEPIPPLPTSTSYPFLTNRTAVTEEEDPARTPRKKPRPQSVQVTKKPSMREAGLGLGLASEHSWRPNWKGPSEASRKKSETSITFDMPTTPTQSSKPQTALRRLGSLSKKHGRKLSGGWKFGSSTTLAEPPLPTVFASPAQTMRVESTSAPNSRILNASSTVRGVNPEEVDQAIESWAAPDDDVPVTVKKADRRRNSWNNLSIPRSVLEKQKDLKAGMSAVRRFAKGIESLKRMKDEYERLGLGQRADAEFAQWWEVADVLIEIGSTSAADQEDVKTPTKPSRERRVTLASSAGVPSRPSTPRSSSDTVYHDAVSEDEDGSGPPRASPRDQWRASTGRQDLSKRQLQVLQNMLTCPSTTSVTALPLDPAGAVLPMETTPVASLTSKGVQPETMPITAPSPGDSAFIKPSPSLAAAAMPASKPLKERRSSRAGLTLLKHVIRSLRTKPGPDEISSSPKAARAAVRSPPVSYGATSLFSGDEVPFPTTRSSFSALGRGKGTGTSQSGRRPSVRGMFRSTPAPEAEAASKDSLRMEQTTPQSVQSYPQPQPHPQRLFDSDATLRPSTRRTLTSSTERPVSGAGLDAARSTSAQSAPVDSRVETTPLFIALTPENLGPLLEALQACEAKLQVCLARQRADRSVAV